MFLRVRRAATEADARPAKPKAIDKAGRAYGDAEDGDRPPSDRDRVSRYLTAEAAGDYAGLLRLVTG